jgi:hypothetical protein
MPGTPPRTGVSSFDVRRTTLPADVVAVQALFVDLGGW